MNPARKGVHFVMSLWFLMGIVALAANVFCERSHELQRQEVKWLRINSKKTR